MMQKLNSTIDVKALAEEIIEGRRLQKGEQLSVLMEADLTALCEGANHIREALCGNKVNLCTIINGRSGRCSENCKFCAQAGCHNTRIDNYDFLDEGVILKDCKAIEQEGVAQRYSIVTAGRDLGKDFEKAERVYRRLHEECGLTLCASHGFLSQEQLFRLKEAGVSHYHANIETSERYFPYICTTHTYEDKIREIEMAKEAGLEVCSGGIIGMGETWEDRLDMAVSLAELDIASIPINVLSPIPGTPYEELAVLEEEEVLRTVAIFRYINPTAYIRIAAGRNRFADGGRKLFLSGANAAITGNMLTTVGNNTLQDKKMFQELGYQI